MAYYTYILSSLPALRFGVPVPIAPGEFLRISKGLIPEEEHGLLSRIFGGELPTGNNDILKKWITFDTTLRNELVKIRSARRGEGHEKYIRPGGSEDFAITHIALHAQRTPSILKSVLVLDKARWDYLNELSIGHYFDLDALLIYAFELSILKKWDLVNEADNDSLLSGLLMDNAGAKQ